jgi:purine-binding chemotaxis protein CheW
MMSLEQMYAGEVNMAEIVHNNEFPWLIFKLKDGIFAISCEFITSITILPDNITKIPQMPDYMRGVLNLRGTIIPLVDMRRLFGIKSILEDVSINKYIDAHHNWIDELLETIKTGRPFKLALDPHQCAFGQWYDTFRPPNHLIAHHMKKINEPHCKLHHTGAEVLKLLDDKEDSEAGEKINNLLRTLQGEIMPTIEELLQETTRMIAAAVREMIIVLDFNGTKVGLIADEVHSVDQLVFLSKEASDIKASYDSRYVKGIGKSTKSDEMILLMDEDAVIATFKQAELMSAALDA